MRKAVGCMVLFSVILAAMAFFACATEYIEVYSQTVPYTKLYADQILVGGFVAGCFGDKWDATAGDLTLSFTYDATGLVDDFGGAAHAWAELGVRDTLTGSNFNPGPGNGVWLATDYDWSANTFDPDPAGSPIQDLDDKLLLQRTGGLGESSYDVPGAPPNPWANHGFWFDRDGVDPWQAGSPLAIDGASYNTGGIYDIEILIHALDMTNGTAVMTINGLSQGFETDGDWQTVEMAPAGVTFTCDLETLQVFFGLYGYGAMHAAAFRDITVDGHLKVMRLVRAPSGLIVVAAGAQGYLDQEAPDVAGGGGAVGELEIAAVYVVGETISGCVFVCATDGEPLTHAYFPLTFYAVALGEDFDTRQALFARTLGCWGEPGYFCFDIDTGDLDPGYYDIRLGFPDGEVGWLRVEIVAAE